MAIRQYLTLTKALGKNFRRDSLSLFFSLFFPLLFLLIFGFLYAPTDERPLLPVVAYYDQQIEAGQVLSQILQEHEEFSLSVLNNQEDVSNAVSTQKAEFGLSLVNENLYFYFNPTRMQQNPIYQELARGIAADFDRKSADLIDFINIDQQGVAAFASSELEYMFPGIIALGVVSTGLFAVTISFMRYKEQGVLRRMLATPMSKVTFMMALITTRLLASFISALLVLIAGALFFNVTFNIDWFLFIPYIFIGTIIMIAFGSVITLFTPSVEAAGQTSGIIMTIMVFFSGIYLPVEFLPTYFQTFSNFMPLTYVARGLRYVMNIEMYSLSNLFIETFSLLSVALLILGFVIQKGQWERA